MVSDTESLLFIQDPSIDDIAKLTAILRDASIPSALWGVNASGCYGGELCPLDIEIIINDSDQTRTFELLRSYGCQPSQPLLHESASCPDDFKLWREQAQHHEYDDRRRLRLCTPIYEIPPTGDTFIDSFCPFIIVYSAELVGLPPIPPLSHVSVSSETDHKPSSHTDYVKVSSLPHYILGSHGSHSSLVVPSFARLVESKMHVMLQHAHRPSVWAQQMAELSELVRSPGCEGGIHSLHEIVGSQFVNFAHWVQSDMEGGSTQEELETIRDEYRQICVHEPAL